MTLVYSLDGRLLGQLAEDVQVALGTLFVLTKGGLYRVVDSGDVLLVRAS